MKRKIYLNIAAIFIVVIIAFISCKKNDVTQSTDPVAISQEINSFIWTDMYSYYLWTANVPALNPYSYSSQTALDNYLNTYTDHSKLFNDLLYQPGVIDKWSWIVSDYTVLDNLFQGITTSMGYEFYLVQYTQTNVFGAVKYVVKGGPADLAGIKRGDIFTQINGQQLTVTNYKTLLSGATSYSASFANNVNGTITPNGKTVTLTAAVVNENPIYFDTVFTYNNYKIGYLVYNGFMNNYSNELNTIIGTFKNQSIDHLILDLRYNPGGSVETSNYLASMIYGSGTGSVFFTNQYNVALQNYLTNTYGPNYFTTNFTDTIGSSTETTYAKINALHLSSLYVITTRNTASASELLINGLKPYINVVQVGDTTDGKYVGSITLMDYDNQGNLNPNHKWAMQPIVAKFANSAGVTDYAKGLAPNIIAEEDYGNMLPLGNINEALLKATLNAVAGGVKNSIVYNNLKRVADSKNFIPHAKEMYWRNKPKFTKQFTYKR